MQQCDNCMDNIDVEEQTHVKVVKPMEFKGERQEINQVYCSVGCLVEKVQN